MTIDAIISYAYTIAEAFSGVFSFLEYNVSYYFERFVSWLPFGDTIVKFIENFLNSFTINGRPLGTVGVLYIMIGFGLVFYIGYQFVTWVLNSVT